MSAPSLDRIAQEVLSRYPRWHACASFRALGNAGGFSGARLWQLREPSEIACLRAWPSETTDEKRLQFIHSLLSAAHHGGLSFVPRVYCTDAGRSWVRTGGTLWDLTTWLRGQANFRDHPTPERLESACIAVGRLHTTWSTAWSGAASCPAVHRRLALLADWEQLVHCGWRPGELVDGGDPAWPWTERAWRLLRGLVPGVRELLQPWIKRSVPVNPCLCDIWHDHLLFDGASLVGVVDFGSAKIDHVAVDLARLLGSTVGDDDTLWKVGLSAYGRQRPLGAEGEALVKVLDETGAVLGIANWLMRLHRAAVAAPQRARAAHRLGELVARVESWNGVLPSAQMARRK
jgi:Ser/Thr protein kinase RdoA (MazF antagonist)